MILFRSDDGNINLYPQVRAKTIVLRGSYIVKQVEGTGRLMQKTQANFSDLTVKANRDYEELFVSNV